jgi:hypothetical protein
MPFPYFFRDEEPQPQMKIEDARDRVSGNERVCAPRDNTS